MLPDLSVVLPKLHTIAPNFKRSSKIKWRPHGSRHQVTQTHSNFLLLLARFIIPTFGLGIDFSCGKQWSKSCYFFVLVHNEDALSGTYPDSTGHKIQKSDLSLTRSVCLNKVIRSRISAREHDSTQPRPGWCQFVFCDWWRHLEVRGEPPGGVPGQSGVIRATYWAG